MIIKIKALKKLDFNRVVRYILKDKTQNSFIIRHNLRGKLMSNWITQFEENEIKYRKRKRKNATVLTHEIMSFAKDDNPNLTLTILKDLARKYIEYRGKEAIVLAVPHFDKDHTHIHFLFSGIKYKSSETMRMSHDEFKQLKYIIQQYQMDKYPELIHSIVWHGKGDKVHINDIEYKSNSRGLETNKEIVKRLVSEVKEKAQSDSHFYLLLKEQNIKPYHRGGKVVGVRFKEKKYRWRTIMIREKYITDQKSHGQNEKLEQAIKNDLKFN